jgi:hypothetical protein
MIAHRHSGGIAAPEAFARACRRPCSPAQIYPRMIAFHSPGYGIAGRGQLTRVEQEFP